LLHRVSGFVAEQPMEGIEEPRNIVRNAGSGEPSSLFCMVHSPLSRPGCPPGNTS
jgi:hypothetical protein